MALTQVNSEGIKDGEIKDADVNASAAIAGSKLAAATTSAAGSMSAADKTKLDGVATGANVGAALTGSTDNTICTVTGANAIQGEANLTFNGTTLTTSTDVSITGASGNTRLNFNRTDAAGSNGNQFGLLKFHDNNDNQVAGIEAVRASAVDDADIVFKTRPTGGSATERFRIDSSGTTEATGAFKVKNSGNVSINIRDTSANAVSNWIEVKTAGTAEYNCYKEGVGTAYPHVFKGYLTEYARIDAAGIKFNGDTATANGLDDYEESTYTPVVSGTDGNDASANSAAASYVKIGRVCIVTINYSSSSMSSIGGSIGLRVNLPFTSKASGNNEGQMSISEWSIGSNSISWMGAKVNNNESYARLQYHNGNNNNTNTLTKDGANGSLNFRGTITYITS